MPGPETSMPSAFWCSGRRRWRTRSRRVLRDSGLAEDAAQEAYLRAFRRLGDLDDPGSFAGWLRRIVIIIALNMRRARRVTFLPLIDVARVA